MALAGCDKQGAAKPDEPDPKAATGATATTGPGAATGATAATGPTTPVVDEPADIYGGPPAPSGEVAKPVEVPGEPTPDVIKPDRQSPSEPVRAIYAGPPPDNRKPLRPDEP